jgi:hypothetical protein
MRVFVLPAALALLCAAPAAAARFSGEEPAPSVAARAGLHLAQRDFEEDRPRARRWRDEDDEDRSADRPWDRRRWDERRDRYWSERGWDRRSRRSDDDESRDGYYRERERGASRDDDAPRPRWRGRNSPPVEDDEED